MGESQTVACTALLPIEAKYIALGHTAREAIWIRQFIDKPGQDIIEKVTLYGNNKISIALTRNAESQH